MTDTRTAAEGDAAAEDQIDEIDVAADGELIDSSEIEQLRAERDDYLEQLRRTMADFSNYRRRTEQDRSVIRQFANRDLLMQLLDVQDDFQRALGAIPDDQRENGWVSGTSMIERKLNTVLERAAVTPIDALGQPFDPAVHEAVATDPGSSGTVVVEVYRPGYKLGDQILRAAMVRTGDGTEDARRET